MTNELLNCDLILSTENKVLQTSLKPRRYMIRNPRYKWLNTFERISKILDRIIQEIEYGSSLNS